MKNKFTLTVLIPLIIIVFSLSGCIELLELGEIGEAAGAVEFAEIGEVAGAAELAEGIAVGDLGTLTIADEGLIADEISSVRMLEEGELSIVRNGENIRFADQVGGSRIVLKNGKIVKLPGPLYRINENVFVRRSPFNNSSFLSDTPYSNEQLVIVNDEINGWYEVMLPNHEYGFIPVAAAIISHSKKGGTYKQEAIKQKGFHKDVNYIVNKTFTNSPETKDLIVNITYKDGTFDEASSIKINSIAFENGYNSTPAFFSKYFYIDEMGDQLRLGNLDLIKKLNLYSHADYLLIGNYTAKIRINQIKNDMLTADFNYVLNLINLKNGQIEKSFTNTIYGNGWTDSQARNDALQAFYQIMKQTKF